MQHFRKNVYTELDLADLTEEVAILKERGFRFIQLCATTKEDGVELLYSFLPESFDDSTITALIVQQEDGQAVPSISEIYPESFVFENETHDLFGIDFDGLDIDYAGNFYTTAVPYPMNDRASNFAAKNSGTNNGAANKDGEHPSTNKGDKGGEHPATDKSADKGAGKPAADKETSSSDDVDKREEQANG